MEPVKLVACGLAGRAVTTLAHQRPLLGAAREAQADAARKASPTGEHLKRRIHFYRAVVPKIKGQPGVYDPAAALAHIGGLEFSETGRYMQDGERLLCSWVDDPQRLVREV